MSFPRTGIPSKEAQEGAAAIIAYLQSCFTVAGKDVFTREEIVTMLDIVGNDDEILAPGVFEHWKNVMATPDEEGENAL